MPNFTIKTLGCKVNQYEEQVLRENLTRLGFTESKSKEVDLVIINSCTVTSQADAKTRKLIRRAKKENPLAKVVVTGCYAVQKEDINFLESLQEVDMVVPNKEKLHLPVKVSALFCGKKEASLKEEISSFSAHTRAFLKVQDGCDQKCSYCKVNIVRGPSVSRREKEILEEAARLIKAGYKEIVLTGICLGSWKGEASRDLSHLIEKIANLEGSFRIRLSSIEPNHITSGLIDKIQSLDKLCKHLHIPLQSGSDRILKLMNRSYTLKDFQSVIRKIRKKMPLFGITMDVIVGFPGETEEDFKKTVRFLSRIKPSRLHVFTYSDRKGTLSYGMKDKVPFDVARRRTTELIALGEELKMRFSEKFTGREVDVLLEGSGEGYSGEYVRIELDNASLKAGDFARVKVRKKKEKTVFVK